jgi:hypothetical protein
MRKWLFVLMMLLAGIVSSVDYHYCYEFSPCDSIMFIKEFNGVADTVVHVNDSIFDTTIAETEFDTLGNYFMFLRLKYVDEANWVRGFDVYPNLYAAGGTGSVISVTASTDTFITTVWGFIVNMADTGIGGAKVIFSLSESRVFREYDSSLMIPNKYEVKSDDSGLWQVDVPASNRLFITSPTKDTLWYTVVVSYGGLSVPPFKKVFVPDTTSISFGKIVIK